jgi:AraC-like DNA-binding protein
MRTLYEFKGHDFTKLHRDLLMESIDPSLFMANCEAVEDCSGFSLSGSRASAGYIPISRHHSLGLKIVARRSVREVRSNSADIFLLWFPIRGSLTIIQNGRSATIEPGSFGMCYGNDPLSLSTEPDAKHEHLSYQLTAPAHLVSQLLPEPKRHCAISFSTGSGAARIARELVVSLYDEEQNLDRDCAEMLAISALTTLFETMNAADAQQDRSLTVREVKVQRLMDHFEVYYSDPELTTRSVAAACGISTRYLHFLLKGMGKRFFDHLWQLRLDAAYAQLTSPSLSRRTISEVAYTVGFKSSAHFSRAFGNRYGVSPREARKAALEAAAALMCGSNGNSVPERGGHQSPEPRLPIADGSSNLSRALVLEHASR